MKRETPDRIGKKANIPGQPPQRLVVRGYRSSMVRNLTCVVFPRASNPKGEKKYPLYIWLHGRRRHVTDLHFIHERMTAGRPARDVAAIVLHPFGRQCVGFQVCLGESIVLLIIPLRRRRRTPQCLLTIRFPLS